MITGGKPFNSSFIPDDLKQELVTIQKEIEEWKIPVIVLLDGWEGAYKNEAIEALTVGLNARRYSVARLGDKWSSDWQYNYLIRFWNHLPEKGCITFYSPSPYSKVFDNYKEEEARLQSLLNDARDFSDLLMNDGKVIIKLFLNVSEAALKERVYDIQNSLPLLNENESRLAIVEAQKYEQYDMYFKHVIEMSNSIGNHWQVVNMDSWGDGSLAVIRAFVQSLKEAIKEKKSQAKPSEAWTLAEGSPRWNEPDKTSNDVESGEDQLIHDYEDYHFKLHLYRRRARLLTCALYCCRIPTICVFESNGYFTKDKVVKHLTKDIEPKGYNYFSDSPSKGALYLEVLHAFIAAMPLYRRMFVFDRELGRVTMERIDGFFTPQDWKLSYHEITELEERLVDTGANLIKFFLVDSDKAKEKVSKEEKENSLRALSLLLQHTSGIHTPWHIVDREVKSAKEERLFILETFINGTLETLKTYEEKNSDVFDWKNFWLQYEMIGN